MSEVSADVKDLKPQPSKSETPYPGAACVICLDTTLKDPTILDSCLHFFCYECINQWLLTNPSCPMCKKPLNKIKHNLSPLPEAFPVPYNSISGDEKTVEDLLTAYEMGFLREQSYSPLKVEKRCIEEAIENLYHKTIRLRNLESDGILTKAEVQQKRNEFEEKIRNLTALKYLIANQKNRSTVYGNPEFRRLVYAANLSPRTRLSPRFPADASPNGIVANETLFRKRLIPFALRELTAIIPRAPIDISTYIDLVMKYLKTSDRNVKNAVLNTLHSSGVEHPLHFLNNISHFLASGQRLDVYDENCEYRVRGSASDIRSFFQNDSDNDVEFLNETITIGNPRRPLEQWANNMRNEYFRNHPTNSRAPLQAPVLLEPMVSPPQVITIDGADNDRDPIVLNDSDSILIDDAILLSDDEEGGREDGNTSDNNMFAHPDLLLPSSSRRSRDASESLASRIFSNPSSIFGPNYYLDGLRPRHRSPVLSRSQTSRNRSPVDVTSYSSGRSRSPPSSIYSYSARNRSPTSSSNLYRRRSRSPPSLNLYRPVNRSPSFDSTNAYSELDNRLNIFDGLGPLMRSRQENLYPSRNRSARSRTTPSPTSNDGGPSTSAASVNESEIVSHNESDSDVEIVSHTSSNSRKRPRYEDAH